MKCGGRGGNMRWERVSACSHAFQLKPGGRCRGSEPTGRGNWNYGRIGYNLETLRLLSEELVLF